MKTITEKLSASFRKTDADLQKEREASLFESMFLEALQERQKLIDLKKFSPSDSDKKE